MQTCRIYIFQVLRSEYGEDQQFFAYHEEGDETFVFPVVWSHFLEEVTDAIQHRLDHGWGVEPSFDLPGKEACEMELSKDEKSAVRMILTRLRVLVPA